MPRKTKRPFIVTLTPEARQDIRDILRWSEWNFGVLAAGRYRHLLRQAIRDLAADPVRPGSLDRRELGAAGARTYHLALSRSRAGNPGVKHPRHYLLYRCVDAGTVEVARILHDSSDLSRHVPSSSDGEPNAP